MDDEIVLTWSFANWVTVVLMVVIGFALITLAAQGYHAVRKRAASEG